MELKKLSGVLAGTLLTVSFVGCVSPDFSKSTKVDLDDDSMDGGISSADVRGMASKMCPSILGLPELSGGKEPVRIKLGGVKNSSRFFIDKNIFSKKLALELNKYGQGQVRFLSDNELTQASRSAVIEDRDVENVKAEVKSLARAFVDSPVVVKAEKPVKLAVVPVLNANLVNLNADSFAAMFRSEVAELSKGKVQFLMPGETKGADYWISGQFYPESMKREGIINLADYFEVVNERVKSGKDLYVPEVAMASVSPVHAAVAATGTKESVFLEMLRNPELRKNRDCDKKLNLMVVRPSEKLSVWEKTVTVARRVSSRAGTARYVLSGEISGLSQNRNGKMSDYLLISMELTDPDSNEVIWQDAYEVKRATTAGTVYR